MSEPIHMVVINLIIVILTLALLFTYKFIYPKKNIPFLVLLFIISLLPLWTILRPGTFQSGDLSLHVQFAMGFDQSLREGNILPRWNENTCGGYGCPDFIFLYILPYYLISFFHVFGFSFLSSTKILLIVSFIASGITIYLWLKESFGQKAAFIGSIVYLFAPYHFVDLNFRNDVGEVLAFVFYPLMFLFIKKLVDTEKMIYTISFTVCAMLLLTSHTTMFYTAFPLSIIYFTILWLQKNKKRKTQFTHLLTAIIATLLLSLFYWLPLIYESKLIYYSLIPQITLHSLSDLLYSPWRYGLLFQGHKGELSYAIGYVQLFMIIVSLYVYWKYKPKENRLVYWYFFISFIILSFLVTNYSKIVWQTIPFMDKLQDSHRLLLPIDLFTAAISAFAFSCIKNKYFFYALCFLAVTTTILNWGNRATIPSINDAWLKNDLLHNSDGHHDIAPKWVDIQANWSLRRPDQPLQILKGHALITNMQRTTNTHFYSIDAKNNTLLRENTYYFPGWNVLLDGKEIPIDYKYKRFPGLIIFTVPTGRHTIAVIYKDVDIQIFSNTISLITFCIIILYSAFYFGKKFKKRKSKK